MDLKRSADAILAVLDKIPERRVAVFGDYCLDKYLYIDPARDEASVETGRTAYQVHAKGLYPGAGGTVVSNLRALGAEVSCVGIVGEDGEGFELMRALDQIGADTSLMVKTPARATCTYTKPMRGTAADGYTEMNRLDFRNFTPTPREVEDRLLESLAAAAARSQAVIILDQFIERNLAAVTDRVRDALRETAAAHRDTVFFADSRGHTASFRNVIVKCNRQELLRAMGEDGAEADVGDDTVARLAGKLESATGRAVMVTAGEDGAYIMQNSTLSKIPAFSVSGPIDIVGAGDATSAGFVLGMTLGLALPDAALLGGCVSAITIGQIGVTGTATPAQVRERLRQIG